MGTKRLPRYPIYVPSKGRPTACLTGKFLSADGVPFSLVVEPQERDDYAEVFGSKNILVLPFSNVGSVVPARNWIKQHAESTTGAARHWQLDDNIRGTYRRYKTQRVYCDSGVAFAAVEDFTDRYENIAISGMNYDMFLPDIDKAPPFVVNCHVYSCSLILNGLGFEWRGRYNEDTDYCLQVLAGGWCTVLVNAFCVKKIRTMQMKGGNTSALYQGDGRLRMARGLERMWPGVVETHRRWKRPQHVVKAAWRRFTTPLKLKPGIDLAAMPVVDEYGMELRAVKEVRSPMLRNLLTNWEQQGAVDPTE